MFYVCLILYMYELFSKYFGWSILKHNKNISLCVPKDISTMTISERTLATELHVQLYLVMKTG